MGTNTMTRHRSKLKTGLVIGLAAITFGFSLNGIGGSVKADSTDAATQANFVNSGSNDKDPQTGGLTWKGFFEDPTDTSDVSLVGQNVLQGNTKNRSAVNVNGGEKNLTYVVQITNTTDQTLSGRYFTSFYDKDITGYNGAKLRYGSTTGSVQSIDHYMTPNDAVSNVSAQYGLTTDGGIDYGHQLSDISAADQDNIVRLQLDFTIKAGATATFNLPVVASKGDNSIKANQVATAPDSDFTIIFGAMYSYKEGTFTGVPTTGDMNHNLLLTTYDITAITTTKDTATVQTGDTVNAATFGADPTDAKIGKVTDANGNTVTNPTAQPGTYTVELTRDGYLPKTVTLTVTQRPSDNNGNGGSSTGTNNGSGNSSTGSDVDTSTSPNTVIDGQTVAKKGRAIYALKGLYMYNKTTFTKSARTYHYAKQIRTKRPIFIVDGYTKSSNGALRYRVHDYYHKSRKGYITAKSGYTALAYYFSVPKSKAVRVITSTGINSYGNSSLSGKKLTHYKKGTVLKVKKVVKYKLASRFQLTNGRYISGNKTYVIMK